ncbi:MAG: HTTM domain-containing protein, partial [Verrucomicrobiota bacterium]
MSPRFTSLIPAANGFTPGRAFGYTRISYCSRCSPWVWRAVFFYRICITLFFLGFTYVELLDQTAYLNHYYLVSLLSALMIFLPAHRAWSFDAWRKPALRLDFVPAWALNLLRFQIAVVYIFSGL